MSNNIIKDAKQTLGLFSSSKDQSMVPVIKYKEYKTDWGEEGHRYYTEDMVEIGEWSNIPHESNDDFAVMDFVSKLSELGIICFEEIK